MSRRSFLLDLKAEGALALWHDYRRGDAQDMSGNGNHGTPTDSVILDRNGAKFPATASIITVADHLSLRLTALSIVVLGQFQNFLDNARIISKRDVSGSSYEMVLKSAASQLGIVDSTPTQQLLTQQTKGTNCFGLNATNGEKPEAFVDGISGGLYGANAVLTDTSASVLNIGSFYNLTFKFGDHIGAVVIANRVLTATEHAKLYGELANQDWGQRVL